MKQTSLNENTEYHIAGYVKWYEPVKGFGFIVPELGGADVLLHENTLRSWGVSSISNGSRIEVTAIKTERGFQALAVTSIERPSSDDADDDGIVISGKDCEELRPARVKWFCSTKGYGFANVFGQPDDIFIAADLLRKCGISSLETGEAVSLKTKRGQRGLIASVVLPWRYNTIVH